MTRSQCNSQVSNVGRFVKVMLRHMQQLRYMLSGNQNERMNMIGSNCVMPHAWTAIIIVRHLFDEWKFSTRCRPRQQMVFGKTFKVCHCLLLWRIDCDWYATVWQWRPMMKFSQEIFVSSILFDKWKPFRGFNSYTICYRNALRYGYCQSMTKT